MQLVNIFLKKITLGDGFKDKPKRRVKVLFQLFNLNYFVSNFRRISILNLMFCFHKIGLLQIDYCLKRKFKYYEKFLL